VTAVGETSYAYDANGNMTTRGSQTLTWDYDNRPVSITDGGNTSTFVYDGNGNRVKKTEGGETILYINKYYEKNLITSEVTTSYYLGARLIAQRKGTTLNYIHQDHLSGTAFTSDSSGAQTSTIKYFPFGATRSTSGTVPTDKKFTGQRLDETGLYYYGARYYDASIGRFISADSIVPDPANPQTFNRYSYCLNNPLRYIDPSGLDVLLVGGSDSTYDSMMEWRQQVIDSGMLAEGEEVYIIWDIDSEIAGIQSCDVAPRYTQLDTWLSKHQDVTDLKIISHSEGAAATGTYIADWLHGTGNVSESSANLLNSQLKGVFLVEPPTGISNIRVNNYDWTRLNGLGEALGRKNIKAANIYNACSIVNSSPLEGWDRYNVASWNDYLISGLVFGGDPIVSVGGFIGANIYNHSSAKKDSLTVIKSILQD
jgi:RHS repeat-associated protein